jgi:hypothetical protein
MLSRLKRRKIKLTKRKHYKTKTKTKTKRRQMKRKRTHRFRKSKKQYGGKFNDIEIEQIKDALRIDKNFTEEEINSFVERVNKLAQPIGEHGTFPLFINFLQENDEGIINTWINGREREWGDNEPQTDDDASDIEVLD